MPEKQIIFFLIKTNPVYMEDKAAASITWRHLAWDIVVFMAVIFSLVSVSFEVAYNLSESRLTVLYFIDVAALTVFIIDLFILWRCFDGPFRDFLYRNKWDVLSAIPVFRIIRIARYARILKIARFRRIHKLVRVSEVEEKLEDEIKAKKT